MRRSRLLRVVPLGRDVRLRANVCGHWGQGPGQGGSREVKGGQVGNIGFREKVHSFVASGCEFIWARFCILWRGYSKGIGEGSALDRSDSEC